MPTDPITILLVEDNTIDIKAIKRAFQRSKKSYPFVVANDGLEALAVLRGSEGRKPLCQPYLILLDLNMPRMSGLEFLDEIRRDRRLRRSVVFVLTTSEDDRDKLAAYDRQTAGYLSKNDTGGDYLSVIQLLDQYQHAVHFPPAA